MPIPTPRRSDHLELAAWQDLDPTPNLQESPTESASYASSEPSIEYIHGSRLHQLEDSYLSPAGRNNYEGDEIVLTSYDEDDLKMASTRCVFRKAADYLQPGPFYRTITNLYDERKLLVFFLMHFMSTMIIWFHFAYIKFEERRDKVPEGAPSYWWKRIVPPLEFGSMHAILFQMAFIPLTMCRLTIAALSDSVVDRFVPMNRSLRIHIHLGYTMVLIVFLATLFFFLFFGLLCSRGEQSFCDKFRSEIMSTGYAILGTLLIIAGTSYFRHQIPYEIFYGIHHLVFIMYAITIAHTFDREQRRGMTERSQTFKWFSSTLLYYFCDRVAMHMNQKYRARLISSSTVVGSDGSRMIILKLQRPTLFRFSPGQYAYLKLGAIDPHWHPFSIASEPDATYLEFYIEVFDDASWTGQLWSLLENYASVDGSFSLRQVHMEVMGPFGTRLAKTKCYTHALAFGTGTGIVPILSLFKDHVQQLLRLSPEAHFEALSDRQAKTFEIEIAEESKQKTFFQCLCGMFGKPSGYYERFHQTRSDSLRETIKDQIYRRHDMSLIHSPRTLRGAKKDIQRAAFWATRSIYGIVAMVCLPVLGLSLIAMTISWNTTKAELRRGMLDTLKASTILFQLSFAAIALFIWYANSFFSYVDFAFCVMAPFVNWYWFLIYDRNGVLSPCDVTTYTLFIGYMTFRLWNDVVQPRHHAVCVTDDTSNFHTLDRLDVVWIARSASMVARILPDIEHVYASLFDQWGEDAARSVCKFEIFVTDKDQLAREALLRELKGSLLFQNGFINFGRPDIGSLIEDHTIGLVTSRRTSHTLLAYVGSPDLSREIHRLKISNDMVTAITGNKNHQMDYVAESYFTTKSRSGSQSHADEVNTTTRKQTVYSSGIHQESNPH